MKNQNNPISRRQFLKSAAATVGGALLIGTGFVRSRDSNKNHILSQMRPLLGTFATLTIHHSDFKHSQNAMQKAFAAIEKVDAVMSIHRPDSDLSRVNQNAGREMIAVNPSLCEILTLAEQIGALSKGSYNVNCLPLMKLYGFYSQTKMKRHFPSDRSIQKVLDAIDSKNIVVDAKNQRVGLLNKNCGIDLGSIGKGFAVDAAVQSLRDEGIKNAWVDLGGNIFAMGTPQADPSEKSWKIAIRNPQREGAYFETLELSDAAVATSGNYEQTTWLDGQKVGHLFDMRRGNPSATGVSTTIVAANATLADGLSTASFLLGTESHSQFHGLAKEIIFHGLSA